MLKKGKCAIVRLKPRKEMQCRLCALLPQAEGEGPTGRQVPGFHAVWLPWADDIRKPEAAIDAEKLSIEPTKEQVQKAKAFVDAFTIDFNCQDFDKPDLQHF